MNVDFKSIWASLQRQKRAMKLAGLVLLLAGAGLTVRYVVGPPSPWMVRWQVQRYLKNRGASTDFTVEFPFPSRAEMSRSSSRAKDGPPALEKGPRTGKDFDTLRQEYLRQETALVVLEREILESEVELRAKKAELENCSAQLAAAQAEVGATNVARLKSDVKSLRKRVASLEETVGARPKLREQEAALDPVLNDLVDFQYAWVEQARAASVSETGDLARARRDLVRDVSAQLETAVTYEEMYTLIGRELWVARRLLKSANPEHRETGLSLAVQAGRHAFEKALNSWLAARICEGYIWPNLDLATSDDRRSPLQILNLINSCAQVFRDQDEFDNLVRNYRLLLARADRPQVADWAHAQIAVVQEQQGNFQDALDNLRQIQSTNDFRWALRRIPQLEQRLQ